MAQGVGRLNLNGKHMDQWTAEHMPTDDNPWNAGELQLIR